jgi:hypothetical protein
MDERNRSKPAVLEVAQLFRSEPARGTAFARRALASAREEGANMTFVKTIALATVLMFGASQVVFAQAGNPYAGGGGAGTESGHPEKAQNNNRGPGKNPGGPGQGYQ